MSKHLRDDVHAMVLPAFAGTVLSEQAKRFLDNGGVSILLGETREEYVARRMSEDRRSSETVETLTKIVGEAKARSDTLLVCVDQEISGICRLHDLVAPFPASGHLVTLTDAEMEELCCSIAATASSMGVNVFLAPVLDLVTGTNPWLAGRTYSTKPETVGRISAAYVRGVQKGGVAATGKHFPGFQNLDRDPAIDPDAVNSEALATFDVGFKPFRDVIAVGIEMIMVGPAIVSAFDPDRAALRSRAVVDLLKEDLSFGGVVMADDLDSRATMRSDSVEQVAIDAVRAGCDFLLLADIDNQLQSVPAAIVNAVETGLISAERVHEAAEKVRGLARRYETGILPGSLT